MIGSAMARHWRVGVLAAGMLVVAGVAMAQHIELPGSVGTIHVITPVPITPITPSLMTPSFKPTPTPSLAAPVTVTPTLAAPVATPAPIAAPVARQVRFRCEVLPQDQSCREHSETPDGDAHDDQCDCSRDYCYPAPDGNRVCEKLQ